MGVLCGSVAEPQMYWMGRAQCLTCMFSEGHENRGEMLLLAANSYTYACINRVKSYSLADIQK